MPGFRQLQALHAVINAGTVTAAADVLGISQPGISNLLSQLENQTHLTLFKRSRGRVQPTPEAMVLFHEFDTVVRGFDQISQTVTDLQTHRTGHLQVVSTHALSQGFLPILIAGFVEAHPEITVAFDARYSAKIQEWIVSNLFEVGITELPVEHDNLETELYHFECRCVVPSNSPLSELDIVTPEDLDNVPFIALGNEHMTHHRVREAFVKHHSRLRVRCQVNLFRTALNFVKQDMGVSLIDPFTLADDDGTGYISLPFQPAIHLDMAIIHTRNRPLSSLAEEFLKELRKDIALYAA